MKKMLWQLPAVISGTAVLTFSGVSVLQAAVNGPLQERGAIVLAERAGASERAETAAKVKAMPVVGAGATRATAPAAALPASPTTSCLEAACGGPVGGPARPAGPADAPVGAADATGSAPGQAVPEGPKHEAGGQDGQTPAGPAGPAAARSGMGVGADKSTAPGQARDAGGRPAKANGNLLGGPVRNGAGAGKSTAPGQSRDADGRPAKANGSPQSGPAKKTQSGPAKKTQSGPAKKTGNGADRAKGTGAPARSQPADLGPAGEAAREAARWIDRLLGLPEPPGLSGVVGRSGADR